MKNTFGTSLSLTIFGESHGAAVGAVLDGMAAGVPVEDQALAALMDKRRARGDGLSTARVEADQIRILSGVVGGHTTGTPITLMIENQNTRSGDYAATAALLRPGHADYTAFARYRGYQDARGGGHFSGRITSGLVAGRRHCAGGPAAGRGPDCDPHRPVRRHQRHPLCPGRPQSPWRPRPTPWTGNRRLCPAGPIGGGPHAGGHPCRRFRGGQRGRHAGNRHPGPARRCGEPFFDSVESLLAHMAFSVPAVKGIEFGEGFGFAALRGSQANDPFRMEDGHIVTETNRNAGINGGPVQRDAGGVPDGGQAHPQHL